VAEAEGQHISVCLPAAVQPHVRESPPTAEPAR